MTPWELPTGNAFLEEIGKGHEDGCHMVIVLPATMLTESTDAVAKYFYQQRVATCHVTLKPGMSVRLAICNELNLPIQDWKVLLQTDIDEKLVLLSGFEVLPKDEQANVTQELIQAARLSHSGENCWYFLLFVLPGDDGNLRTDLRLRIIPWWNRLGIVDVEYVFQRAVSSQSIESDIDFLWCYSLLHSLRDPSLATTIINNLPRTFEEIQTILEEHPLFDVAQKYSENISCYQQHSAVLYIYDKEGKTPIDKKIVPMWRHGFICGNDSLHPVAMHAAKRTKDLEKCIAKGQVRVLLPIIQDVHTALMAYLNVNLPGGWLNRIEKDEDLREAIRTEIGPLTFCVKKLCYEERLIGKAVCDLAFAWRGIRNSLAHYKPIQYGDLKSALALSKNLLQK